MRILLCLLLTACVLPVRAQPFVRQVAPFPVSDSRGVLGQPFAGGLDRPRPTLADVDGDGDADLLVHERTGTVMLFENSGGRLLWRTDRFGGLEVGEWLRLVDMDDDGDLDAFAEQPLGYVRYFGNTGGQYTQLIDTLKLSDGTRLNIDRQNLPTFGDLTCDGTKDLLVAEIDGTLTLYPGLPPSSGAPRFGPPIERYQNIQIVGEVIGKREAVKHGATNLKLADVDGDGDLDLLWGDFFSPSLYLVRDETGCPAPHFVRATDTFPDASFQTGGYNAPTWGDLDGDGLSDLVVGTIGGAFLGFDRQLYTHNLHHFRQTAPGVFARQTDRLVPTLDVGNYSSGALGDLDGDGDLDLVAATRTDTTGGQGRLFAWENTGTAFSPRFEPRALALPEDTRFALVPTLGDLSGDGRPDLLVGAFDGSVRYLRATGPFAFELVDEAVARLKVGSNAAPALGDLNGDGRLDLLVGKASGFIEHFRNVGTGSQPLFFRTTETFVTRADVKSTPALADVDGDGDLDLVVGTQTGAIVRYENTGIAQEAAFAGYTSLVAATPAAPLPADTAPLLGDLDGDGDLDLLFGESSGGFLFYRNNRLASAVEPSAAAGAVIVRHAPQPNPSRQAVALYVELAAPVPVEVCVFDLLGRQVACAGTQPLGAGVHALALDLRDAAAGVYLYRLRAGAQTATGCLVRLP